MPVRSAEEFNEVQRLIAEGLNDCAIARRTRIPRRTVRDWRCRPQARLRHFAGDSACGIDHDFGSIAARPYCYLLGLYLGDGCISRSRRVWRLRIFLDAKYPAIVDSCRQAIDALMPRQHAALLRRKSRCFEVSLCSKHWPCLLPQHGPGKKHNRRIALESWQEVLVKEATEDFIRGLIHSDGCRVVANDRGVRSIRYHFSNRSEDIIGLFTGALDHLGIPWTRSTKYIVSVYRKARPRALTSSSAPSAERYRRCMSTTRRRRPALIALVIVAALTCLALGWWQWQRYESTTGTGQNLGYALQWPVFAGFVVYAYRKFVRYEEEPPQLGDPNASPKSLPGSCPSAQRRRPPHPKIPHSPSTTRTSRSSPTLTRNTTGPSDDTRNSI